ncbi:MAG TPA: hypothetical protein VMD25_02045 [Acidobacteriaceae bacterium]|nr:hypothetical protein [Acidobacteriaceae bacterium]
MEVSREQALSLCRKWLEEGAPVRFLFESGTVTGRLTGRVAKVSDLSDINPAIGIVSADFSEDEMPASLAGISLNSVRSFAFADPREAGSGRDVLESEMDFGVIFFFITGERCILYELPHNPDLDK